MPRPAPWTPRASRSLPFQLTLSLAGDQFFAEEPTDLVDFQVLSSAASAYQLSAFFGITDNLTVYMDDTFYNDEGIDASFTIDLDSSTGIQLSTSTLNVTDNNTSSTTGFFANFALTGLVAGDIIHVIATPAETERDVQYSYVGGVGFTEIAVPEPSTYAMMFLGAGALVFLARRKLA